MNHCDLEEAKRLVEMRIDEALADTAGWEYRVVVGRGWGTYTQYEKMLCHDATKVCAKLSLPNAPEQDYIFDIMLNGRHVGRTAVGTERHEALQVLQQNFYDQETCRKLLEALNPPPAIDTTKDEWEVVASSENDTFDPHPLAVIGAGILIGIVLTIAALAIWGGA